MQISRQSYFVTQLISRQDTGIAQVHCQSALQLLHVSLQVIDISVMTGDHRASCSADRCESLGSLTLSHRKYLRKIQALHKCIANQCSLQLLHVSLRVIDISAMTGDHRSLGHLVAPTDANLSAVSLCHTVNISARYRHCTSALPISASIISYKYYR